MKLIIVRHGETEENVRGEIQGHGHGKLTKKGIGEAKKLAMRLKDEKFDLIFSSDLGRAKDTAAEIIKRHEAEVIYTPELREMSHGVLEGKHFAEREVEIARSGKPMEHFIAEGGESLFQFRERVRKFLESLHKHKGKNILIVTHGGFLRMIFSIVFGKSIEESLKIGVANASINILELEDKGFKVHLINSIEHL